MFFDDSNSPWAARALSVLRIVTGLLFFEHGLQKVFDLPPAATAIPYHPISLLGLAGMIETIGGLLIIVGLFTRPAAVLASGEMAVAYFKVHIERSFFPINNRGDNVVLFCFVMLYLAFAGGGVWALDHWLASRRRTVDSASSPGSPSRSRPPSRSPAPVHATE
ncbi:MAG TPA: DoxX family protein [Gemmatimonadaceae bacterium]|jgi:putative oxidoreductase|nr:DoxX family protein [Gemmatimonadaceae bacterium]